jgi:hypothetical protein
MAHAKLSPSSAERWMTCPGSVVLSEGIADEGSAFAAEGTAAHELAETILLGVYPPESLVGRHAENGVLWTAEMLRDVMNYVTLIRDIVGLGGDLYVEQRLPIGHLTGEDGAHGTSDAVVVLGDELIVADLKFGRGVVVDAERNPQLMIYGLAALEQFDLSHGPFARVRLIISQPRLGAFSEWTISVEDLQAFAAQVSEAAETARTAAALFTAMPLHNFTGLYLQPSEKACKFCRAKATCPKLQAEVLDMFDTVEPKTAAPDALADAMSRVSLIEGWCKAIRAEAERRLLAGVEVPGWKLVQGRSGARKWGDPEAAEAMLKKFKVKTEEMYDLKLISPTTAEKLATTKALGPRQWTKLQNLVIQAEGSPSVAPASDRRPALQVSAATDDFADLTAAPAADDLL